MLVTTRNSQVDIREAWDECDRVVVVSSGAIKFRVVRGISSTENGWWSGNIQAVENKKDSNAGIAVYIVWLYMNVAGFWWG
jgi:hypothetical protein